MIPLLIASLLFTPHARAEEAPPLKYGLFGSSCFCSAPRTAATAATPDIRRRCFLTADSARPSRRCSSHFLASLTADCGFAAASSARA